ncbi:phosphonate ABC transporter ATP-binding protein [Salisediminibacterium beveridgei]|uniref:Phosphonate ABC transporter ATP-binding protein n=1 Tax=Salisediminibacterium beveridgei TaxID=632773 RepID=A0A1D7QZ69_9BACI|nr:phosphonate ABC transporter ATP-binding protein [Salisediminibacterium beveridgei]AOM84312.1 Phosphonate ABC transporter ATP-binding protein [Salisediminibacterium beveridgei]
MIEVNDLTVRYPSAEQPALDQVSFQVAADEFVCVLGKSGAGKSTLIRCLNGLQQPSSGSVTMNQDVVTGQDERTLRLIRSRIGMIFQHFQLIPRLTVEMNVFTGMFGSRPWWQNLLGLYGQSERKLVNAAIVDVELNDYQKRRVEDLSGGQKQRVAIARALAQNPVLFLGDEPVASLDPGTAERIFTQLQVLQQKRGMTMFINVHDVVLAKRFATRILALKDGKLVFDGTPEAFDADCYQQVYGQ